MVTLLKPTVAVTEPDYPWLSPQNILQWDSQVAMQQAYRASHVAGHTFDHSRWFDGKLPDHAEVSGIEIYFDHQARGRGQYRQVVEERTFRMHLTADQWHYGITYQADEYIEVLVTGVGTWDAFYASYPEGSYWFIGNSGYPHAEQPCNVNLARPSGGLWYSDNSPPFSVVACVRPASTLPGAIGYNLRDTYRVGRYSYLDPDRLGYSDAGSTHSPGGWHNSEWYSTAFPYRKFVNLTAGTMWFGFNDVSGGAFGDNTGYFDITIRRIRVELPEPNHFLSCPADNTHFPPFSTANGSQTNHIETFSATKNSWTDTGIDVQPGQSLSFLINSVVSKSLLKMYPEGYYPAAPNNATHYYDPAMCAATVGTFPTDFPAPNCRPYSVCAYIVPYDTSSGSEYNKLVGGLIEVEPEMLGFAPPTPGTGFQIAVDAVQLNRHCTVNTDDFVHRGGRLLVILNDAKTAFAANTGTHTVTIYRGSGTNDRLDIGISLAGYTYAGTLKTLPTGNGLRTSVLGSPTDLWGKASWTPQELNNLARIVSRRPIMVGECTITTRELDSCWLAVYWNEPGGLFDVAEREAVKQKLLFGKETTKGTNVPATHRALGFKVTPTPNGDFKAFRPQGNKLDQLQMLMREWASSSVSGIPTYDEMGYILASAICKPQSSGGVVGDRNVHVFRYDNRYEQDLQTYSFEYGTPDSRAHEVSYGFFPGWGINFTRSDAELSGAFLSQAIVDGATMTPGVNNVQDLAPAGTPTGGTHKLRFKGAETAAITFSSTMATWATAVQTALNALPTIGASGVSVAANGSTSIRVTFNGAALAGLPQPKIEFPVSGNSLSGGTNPTVDITHFTSGGHVEQALIPILPGHVSVYIADTYETLAAGKLTRARMASFALENRAEPMWVLNQGIGGFAGHVEAPISMKFNLELQADSNGMALLSNARSGVGKFLRLECVGPLISGSDYHRFTLDAFVKVSAFGEMGDNDGIYQTNYELSVAEDLAWGNTLVATLENGKTGY